MATLGRLALTGAAAALLLTTGCGTSNNDGSQSGPTPTAPRTSDSDTVGNTPQSDDNEPIITFTATLHIAPKPGGKRLQAVDLRPDSGDIKTFLIDYRANGWWRPFEGQRLRVTGRRWSPDPRSQHVMAEHFRVETLTVLPTAGVASGPYVALGAPQQWRGKFETVSGPPGSKLADETWVEFVATDTRRFRVISPKPEPRHIGTASPVTVKGRLLTPSKHAAHAGGDVLWVRSIATP